MHISEKSLNLSVAGFQYETNTCDRSQFIKSVDINTFKYFTSMGRDLGSNKRVGHLASLYLRIIVID